MTSSAGGSAKARVTRWPVGEKPPPTHPGYEKDFVTHYMTPEDVYQRIEKLHAEFPELTDIIDLPYRTHGYRRHAQALIGTPRSAAVVVTTRKLLRQTDIFVVPSVNPDGANYSFYDFNFQRKNMTNHCPPAKSDPARRNRWGVDVNRNYAVGSVLDGYFGASHNCLSGVYAGPGELSEPESRDVVWLANHHPNIRFAMNIHSFGGYFMWPPGAYKLDGRVSLPRPTKEEEAFFEKSAGTIERAIAAERGNVTWPQQTGPVVDVLYSAAGNSADQVWYENDISGWDFEGGSDRWDPEQKRWEGVGFQPPFSEGHAEAMEYASGLIALIGVAADYQRHH